MVGHTEDIAAVEAIVKENRRVTVNKIAAHEGYIKKFSHCVPLCSVNCEINSIYGFHLTQPRRLIKESCNPMLILFYLYPKISGMITMSTAMLNLSISRQSRHSTAEHGASARFLHLTLILATHLISAQVFFTPLASSSTALRHVFFGSPLYSVLLGGFHSRACLVISLVGFRGAWPRHPHLCFLICKSILGCFVCFHSLLFVIWSGQKILSIFSKFLLIKICSLVVIYFEFFQVAQT